MRIIIVPTDFSNNAFHALTCTFEYFKYETSKFILINAYGSDGKVNAVNLSIQELQHFKSGKLNESKQGFHQLLDRINDLGPNPKHKLETLSVFGNLVEEINRLVDQENADLIAMGTRGDTIDRKIKIGSNTLQVLKYVKCPVLGIPMDYKYNRPERILFPSNLQIPYRKRELKLISCLAKSFRSQMHLLYIANYDMLSNKQNEIKDFWEHSFRESEIKFQRRDQGDHPSILLDYIEENDIDLLVMANSNDTFLETLIQTSTVDEIGLSAKIPFLILQNLPR